VQVRVYEHEHVPLHCIRLRYIPLPDETRLSTYRINIYIAWLPAQVRLQHRHVEIDLINRASFLQVSILAIIYIDLISFINNSTHNITIIMARFWASSQTAPAAGATTTATAGTTTAASAKHGRLVRHMDETDENLPPRTPEQKGTRPLRPRSASRDASGNYINNNSSNSSSNILFSGTDSGGRLDFSSGYSIGGAAVAEDNYPMDSWSEQHQPLYEHADLQQLNDEGNSAVPRRSRMNSRDIPRSYSGLYGFSDGDLLPFELNRRRDTFGTETNTAWFLGVYLTLVFAVQLFSLTVMSDMRRSWTVTNAIHLIITLIYVHWLKGSLYDEQGEMNALTVWEQLEATQGTKPVRQVLLIVPTVLTYTACWAAQYDKNTSILNIVLWLVAIAAKLPFMNGVRIFGINRTAGIDDNDSVTGATTTSAVNVSSDKKTE
jgi:hypothetical protein